MAPSLLFSTDMDTATEPDDDIISYVVPESSLEDANRPSTSSHATSLEPSASQYQSSPGKQPLRRLPSRQRVLDPNSYPDVIPPTHKHRTLVLCFDGTGDQFDDTNSNIVQLFSLLKKDDRTKQMVYYQAGLGTYTSPQVVTPWMSKMSKTADSMIAWNLDAHVMDGYEFLMQNYIAGGFSRGAYTARSLAGMIHKVGLLPPDNWQQVPFAYKMYSDISEAGWKQSDAFKQAFSIDVDIRFVGVWDTVNSVGIIPRRLPFTVSNTIVHTFRHAVSLDEHRAKFTENLWHKPGTLPSGSPIGSPILPELQTVKVPADDGKQRIGILERIQFKPSERKDETRKDTDDSDLTKKEKLFSLARNSRTTDVLEVWFAGCHSDVGGGSVKNSTRNSLARISLRWMVRECFRTNTGILFEAPKLEGIGLDPLTLYPYITDITPKERQSNQKWEIQTMLKKERPHLRDRIQRYASTIVRNLKNVNGRDGASSRRNSRRNTSVSHTLPHCTNVDEAEEELRDALSPEYDQLKLQPLWRLLEFIPMEIPKWKEGHWAKSTRPNLGKPRTVPEGAHIHRSVRIRLQAIYSEGKNKGHGYLPRAKIPGFNWLHWDTVRTEYCECKAGQDSGSALTWVD